MRGYHKPRSWGSPALLPERPAHSTDSAVAGFARDFSSSTDARHACSSAPNELTALGLHGALLLGHLRMRQAGCLADLEQGLAEALALVLRQHEEVQHAQRLPAAVRAAGVPQEQALAPRLQQADQAHPATQIYSPV